MSTVEAPPPPASVERRCARCGARLSAEQEWCLECGAAVGTRVAAPRGWRASIAVVGVLLAVALIAVVLALVELAREAEQVAEVAQTPAPTAAPAAPSATPAPTGLAEWPEGRTAWTVVLSTSGTRADAQRLATEMVAKGVPAVGVLDSNDFESLGPDSFVVFSGQHENRRLAEAALATIREPAGGGSTRRIVPARSSSG